MKPGRRLYDIATDRMYHDTPTGRVWVSYGERPTLRDGVWVAERKGDPLD